MMRRSSACFAQRAMGGFVKVDGGSSAPVPDRPLPASSAAAPARARPPSAAGAPPPGSLVRGAFDRSMAARLVQPARASFVLVESCGPVQKCCRYTRVAEGPKDKVPESKSFGSFETLWIEYVVQTYTCKIGQRFTLKTLRLLWPEQGAIAPSCALATVARSQR
jgi:hypothetical protein